MIEGVFFLIFLLGISNQIYIENIKIWVYLIFTLIRMVLISTLVFDINYVNYVLFESI
jgi:hypothetical protein